MMKFLLWIATRATCLLLHRHRSITDKAIFGRVLRSGDRQGLHICPYCGCYVWLPDTDPEMVTKLN